MFFQVHFLRVPFRLRLRLPLPLVGLNDFARTFKPYLPATSKILGMVLMDLFKREREEGFALLVNSLNTGSLFFPVLGLSVPVISLNTDSRFLEPPRLLV
jgi:hypothetical protein